MRLFLHRRVGATISSPFRVASVLGLGSGTLGIVATPGSRCQWIVAPKGAGSSPVGHPMVCRYNSGSGQGRRHFDTTTTSRVGIRSGLDNRGARVAYRVLLELQVTEYPKVLDV